MPPVRAFRTSLYLTLAAAVGAIGVAGGDLLPEIPFITAFCLLLLAVAYALEGRFELSLRDANLVGLFLFALLGLWAIFQAVRPSTGLVDSLPWPASALPYLAPVLMILIPAKMLRPKHVGDYWVMHGLGLLAMALACAMASEGGFVVVFGLYAAAFVWSLWTFHLYRELGPDLAGTVPLAGGRWRAARHAVVWSVVAGSAAIPLFWLTPRSGSRWELGINTRGRATSGVSEGPVDLNTVGSVTVNTERAFEVFAEDASGRPVLDLPADQRWRGYALHNYEGGRWVRNQFSFKSADQAVSPTPPTRNVRGRLPNLGPEAVYLSFTLDPRLSRITPLADQVAWRSGDLSPVASRFDNGTYRSWSHRHDGSLDGAIGSDTARTQYTQVWAPPAAPGTGPVMRLQPTQTDYLTRPGRGLGRLKQYTDQVVERLVADGTLPQAVLTDVSPATFARPTVYHEAIARALERHLAASGEFSYTLDLTRKDKALDPTEDFVLNTKAGHCQRFATALVLMLRSQGIPSQMVVGYRGCEPRGDGWYDVREDHAHAWVEVLLPASDEELPPAWTVAGAMGMGPLMAPISVVAGSMAPASFQMPSAWQPMRWLTLDPTPAGPGPDEAGTMSLLEHARQKWEALLKALLLAYNKESREQSVAAIEEWVTEGNGGFYLAGGVLGLVGFRYARRRRARRRAEAAAAVPTYLGRVIRALARAGYRWPDGQTAREFAREASAGLRRASVTADVADVPERVVAAYYAERFGQIKLDDADRRRLDAGARALEAAVR